MGQIRMKRTGRVHTTKSTDTQCKHTGHDNYGYEVRVTCHEQNKDAKGFIIDNMIVQELMQGIMDSDEGGKSCETLVCCMANKIAGAAKDHGVMVEDVYVHLWPIEGATPVDSGNMASFEYSQKGRFS